MSVGRFMRDKALVTKPHVPNRKCKLCYGRGKLRSSVGEISCCCLEAVDMHKMLPRAEEKIEIVEKGD